MGLSSFLNPLSSFVSKVDSNIGVGTGALDDKMDRGATDDNNSAHDAKNTKTLNSRNSQADEMDSIADQSAENAIAGAKVKLAEARMKRSNDSITSMAQIG